MAHLLALQLFPNMVLIKIVPHNWRRSYAIFSNIKKTFLHCIFAVLEKREVLHCIFLLFQYKLKNTEKCFLLFPANFHHPRQNIPCRNSIYQRGRNRLSGCCFDHCDAGRPQIDFLYAMITLTYSDPVFICFWIFLEGLFQCLGTFMRMH